MRALGLKYAGVVCVTVTLLVLGNAAPGIAEAQPEGDPSVTAISPEPESDAESTEDGSTAGTQGENGVHPAPELDAEASDPIGEEMQVEDLGSLMDVQPAAPIAASAWVETPTARIFGQGRYETAVEISRQVYPDGASTVLIATGEDYPDALGAAALAARLSAPLLLVATDSVPAVTESELARLNATKVIIVGGPGVVSAHVESSLAIEARTVTRVYGSGRYETSIAIARSGWDATGAAEVFAVTGENFADALSAGAAAGKLGIPVILVPGESQTAPANILQLLSDLNVQKVRIAGGTGAVSQSIADALSKGRVLERYSGTSRYDTSAEVVKAVFGTRTETYWATGEDFADALTGAAAAGSQGIPLLISRPDCVPTAIYKVNDQVTSGQTYLLGGAGVLSEEIQLGNECMVRPSGSTDVEWAGTQKLYTSINRARFQAGLSGFRLADAAYGTPAYNWSRSLKTGEARLNTALDSQQPWAAYQTVASTTQVGDKAARLGALLLSDKTARSWLLKPSAGMRGAFSVGYAVSGSDGYATVIVGSNLK